MWPHFFINTAVPIISTMLLRISTTQTGTEKPLIKIHKQVDLTFNHTIFIQHLWRVRSRFTRHKMFRKIYQDVCWKPCMYSIYTQIQIHIHIHYIHIHIHHHIHHIYTHIHIHHHIHHYIYIHHIYTGTPMWTIDTCDQWIRMWRQAQLRLKLFYPPG